MPMPMDSMWQAMSLGMVLVWILVIGAIVAGIVLIVRAVRGPGGNSPARGRTEALRILEERLARGEIDRDEFEERRQALGP